MKSVMQLKFTVAIFLGLICLSINTTIKAEDIVVIAHKSFPADSISADDLEKLYLGKTKTLGDQKAVPITLRDGSVHDSFLDLYLKKNANQFSSYWKKILFTGRGKPPKSASSEEDMLKIVKENEGSIGYVAAGKADDSVKILKVE